MESSPPSAFDEVALPSAPPARSAAPGRTPGSRPSVRPVAGARASLRPGVSQRPSSRPGFDRSVTLEAEIERLKAARAEDADVTAAMLVRIAEAERLRSAAEVRCTELDAEIAQMRQRVAAAEARLDGTRSTMASALTMLDELDRRDEMAASLRTRTLGQVRAALQGQGRTAPPPPDSPFDAGWELPSAEEVLDRSR